MHDWPKDLPYPPVWCDFTRWRGDSQSDYNIRMLAQARNVRAAGTGPLGGDRADAEASEREPGCDDDIEDHGAHY